MGLRYRRKLRPSNTGQNGFIKGSHTGCPFTFFEGMLQSTPQKTLLEAGMIWISLRQAGSDIWDELFHLMLFNVVTLLGTILIIPWPFVTFGLFEMAYDIGQGKGIKFTAFFSRAAQVWKQAYIWGLINLAAIIVILINLRFYATLEASWAAIAQILMVGIATFWFALQLIALPIYPRLEEPGFKLALRNAAILIGRYPFPVLTLLIIVVAVVALIIFVPQLNLFIMLGFFSFTAVLCNRMVGAMVRKELGEEVGNTEQEDPGFNIDVDDK